MFIILVFIQAIILALIGSAIGGKDWFTTMFGLGVLFVPVLELFIWSTINGRR